MREAPSSQQGVCVCGADRLLLLCPHSLEAVAPAVLLLEEVLAQPERPVWINADILAGPGGQAQPLQPQAFLSAVRTLPADTVLSLGWTTGWSAGTSNPGETTSAVPYRFTVEADAHICLAHCNKMLDWNTHNDI